MSQKLLSSLTSKKDSEIITNIPFIGKVDDGPLPIFRDFLAPTDRLPYTTLTYGNGPGAPSKRGESRRDLTGVDTSRYLKYIYKNGYVNYPNKDKVPD